MRLRIAIIVLTCLAGLTLVSSSNAQDRLSVKPTAPKVTDGEVVSYEVTSLDEAKKKFEGEELKKVEKDVDFKKHVLLVIGWRAKTDRLDVAVLESFPPQFHFRVTPAKEKDEKVQLVVYAIERQCSRKVINTAKQGKVINPDAPVSSPPMK